MGTSILRRCALLVAVTAILLAAHAESIQLADGRSFAEAKIVSQTGGRVVIRHAEGLASVEKSALPESLRQQYPVYSEPAPLPSAATAPSQAADSPAPAAPSCAPQSPALSTTLEVPPKPEPQPQQEPDEKAKASATASGLLYDYFASRYQGIGDRVDVSLKLEAPEPVPGWAGRWRLHGIATIRHYRDSNADGQFAKREQEIQETRGISGKKKRRMLERAAFVRAEAVEFEACVTTTGTDAALDVSIR